MIALYSQLQIVTNEPIGKLDPEIRLSRNQSHMRLIEALQEYLQAKLGGETIEVAEGTIFNEKKEEIFKEEVKQPSYQSPDIQLTDIVKVDEAARTKIQKECKGKDEHFDLGSNSIIKQHIKALEFTQSMVDGDPIFRERYLIITKTNLFLFNIYHENTKLIAYADLTKSK
jgi:hypothetical protein